MELGVRIRQVRQELGLSQRQLCGDTITRNMLSQIENGSARPSMDTLQYLAGRLGKPVSWFLEEETVTSPNRELLEKARHAYASGDYGQVMTQLEDYQGPDPVFDQERYLLETLCLMEQAKRVLSEGRALYARSLLEKARQTGRQTAYFTLPLQREWGLCMAQVQPENAPALVTALPVDDREMFLRAHAALIGKDYARAGLFLEVCGTRNARWQYMQGQCAMGRKEYTRAVEHLLQAESTYPKACAVALESCYRELEDYKMAYQYACKLRQL